MLQPAPAPPSLPAPHTPTRGRFTMLRGSRSSTFVVVRSARCVAAERLENFVEYWRCTLPPPRSTAPPGHPLGGPDVISSPHGSRCRSGYVLSDASAKNSTGHRRPGRRGRGVAAPSITPDTPMAPFRDSGRGLSRTGLLHRQISHPLRTFRRFTLIEATEPFRAAVPGAPRSNFPYIDQAPAFGRRGLWAGLPAVARPGPQERLP